MRTAAELRKDFRTIPGETRDANRYDKYGRTCRHSRTDFSQKGTTPVAEDGDIGRVPANACDS